MEGTSVVENYCAEQLPEKFRSRVIPPVRVEHHVDTSANASKSHGFDRNGARCYYRHAFTMTEERFDAEEFPLEVSVYRELVLAWRLDDGKWLKLKEWADRLDQCNQRVVTQAPEITEEADLAR